VIETGTSLVWLFVALPISLPSANYWAMFQSFFSRSEILNSISCFFYAMYPMWIFEPHCSKSEKSRHTKKNILSSSSEDPPRLSLRFITDLRSVNQGKLAPFTSSQFFICTSDPLHPLAFYGKWSFIIDLTGSSQFHPISVHYKTFEEI